MHLAKIRSTQYRFCFRYWQARYALAAVAVAIAAGLRIALGGFFERQPFPTFLMAVLLVAGVAGPGPAILATILSGLCALYLFIEPTGSLQIALVADMIRLYIFTLLGFGIAVFAELMSRARQSQIAEEVAVAERRMRDRAAEKLAANEAFVRSTLDSLPHEIAVVDEAGVVIAVNERWRRFGAENNACSRGISPGVNYLAASEAAAVAGDSYARAAIEGIKSLLGGQQTEFSLEYPCNTPDRQRWFLMQVTKAASGGGAVISHTEITARKQAEDARLESERRFSSFMSHLPGLAWIKDPQGRYVYFNDAAMRAFQKSWETIVGRTDEELFDRQTAATFRANDEAALASESGVTAVETLVHDDGIVHHSLVSKFAIAGAAGEPVGIGGVAIDVTDRVEAEKQLSQATQKLIESDRRKDEFIATLAHELRNPLAPIRNAAFVLKRGSETTPDQRAALLAMIERQVEYLVRLVDDLLDVSRITRGAIELRKQRVALAEILNQAIETASPAIERAALELHVSLPLVPLALEADPVRLEQIFTNLLTNAAKYTNPGGEVFVTAERQGEMAVVSVRDNGVGIPADMLARVFDLFTQVNTELRRAQGGLGIGLALVKRLVEMHGGSVEAQSEGPGRGSAFVVRLPALAENAAASAPGGGAQLAN